MPYDFAIVPAIAMICYTAAEAVKQTALDNKWIPTLCALLGAALGWASHRAGLPILPAEDPVTALAIGIASGFSATGVNQVWKQLHG